MKRLIQNGPTCTETSVAMLLWEHNVTPSAVKHKHIQYLIDLFLSYGYALVEIQPMPSVVGDDGCATAIWEYGYSEDRYLSYLRRFPALIYTTPPDRVPHMYAWHPDEGFVDPRTGNLVPAPQYIKTTYCMINIRTN